MVDVAKVIMFGQSPPGKLLAKGLVKRVGETPASL